MAFKCLRGQGRLKHGCLVNGHHSIEMLHNWSGVAEFMGQCEWCTGTAQCYGVDILEGKSKTAEWPLSDFFEPGVRSNLDGSISMTTGLQTPVMRELHGKIFGSDKTLTKELGFQKKGKSTEITSYVLARRNINGEGVLLRRVNKHFVLRIVMRGFGTHLSDTYDRLSPQGALRVEKKFDHFRDILLFRGGVSALEKSRLEVWLTSDWSTVDEQDYLVTQLRAKTIKSFEIVDRVPMEWPSACLYSYAQGYSVGHSAGHSAGYSAGVQAGAEYTASLQSYGPSHDAHGSKQPVSHYDPLGVRVNESERLSSLSPLDLFGGMVHESIVPFD